MSEEVQNLQAVIGMISAFSAVAIPSSLGWAKWASSRLQQRSDELQIAKLELSKEQSSHQRTKNTLTEIQTELRIVRSDRDKYQAQKTHLQENVDTLYERVSDAEDGFKFEIKRISDSFERRLKESQKDFEVRFNKVSAQNNDFQTQIMKKNLEIAEAHKGKEKAIEAIAERDKIISDKDSHINRLEGRVSALEESNAILVSKFEELINPNNTE